MFNYILLTIGIVTSVIWTLLFLINYGKFSQLIAAANDDNYFFKDIFAVGMGVINILHIDCNKVGQKNKAKMAELYSVKYADFNVLVNISAQISYVMTFIPIGCFIGVAAHEPIMAFLFWLLGAFLAVYSDMKVNNLVQERHDALLMALPNALSKMAILVNVGSTLREAWRIASDSDDGLLGDEMRYTTKLIENGMSETEAYADFAERCKIQQIKKMVSVILQNIEKGSGQLAAALKEISSEAWNDKKHTVKRLGENANNKLIIPIMIMFAGIMVMVLVPILASMGM